MNTETRKSDAENLLDDAAITTKIKAKYVADDLVKTFDVGVTTVNGTVTLTGKVKDEATKNQAVEIAKNTSGVNNVDNKLEINN
jgi:osmotically-inducible protein OsmY